MESIDAAIDALAPDGDVTPILEDLDALGHSRCFAVGGALHFDDADADSEIEIGRRPDSGLALREFWKRYSGRQYVLGYLDIADRGPTAPFVLSKPPFRKTLARETAPHHPLFPLLCSVLDEPCRNETAAYRYRTEMRFWWDSAPPAEPPLGSRDPTLDCIKELETLPPRQRFQGFVACLESYAPAMLEVPAVGIRKPKTGWLLVSGVRGDHAFCDEAAAYDLDTGTAHVTRACSTPSATSGATSSHRTPHEGLQRTSESGTVALEYLRELAWYLLLMPELERQTTTIGYAVPESIVVVARTGETTHGSTTGGGGCGSSGDRPLSWWYVLDGRVVRGGSLTYPGCSRWLAENDYAIELLEVAERSFEARCAPHGPRPALNGGRQAVDASSQDERRAAAALERAWPSSASAAHCRPAPPAPR